MDLPEPLVPTRTLKKVLLSAMAPLQLSNAAALAATAPAAAKGTDGVAVGVLVRWWLAEVWPRHGEKDTKEVKEEEEEEDTVVMEEYEAEPMGVS